MAQYSIGLLKKQAYPPEPCAVCGGDLGEHTMSIALLQEPNIIVGFLCTRCAKESAPALVEARDLFDELAAWRATWLGLPWSEAGRWLQEIGQRLRAFIAAHPGIAAQCPELAAGFASIQAPKVSAS